LRPTSREAASGQSVVEFALVTPILALLLMAILQFAFIYNAQVGITNAVRDAARYGSSLVANDTGTAATATTNTTAYLTAALTKYVAPYSPSSSTITVSYCAYPDPLPLTSTSVRVKVKVVYGHPLLIPLIGGIIDAIDGTPDGKYTITSSLDMRVDNPTSPTPPSLTGC
jgi:Flp pilus assembly protein TadG